MGAPTANMLAAKLTFSLAILFAISLPSTNGQCQLPSTHAVDGVAASGLYTTLSQILQTCTQACLVCGQTVGAATAANPTSFDTQAEMQALGATICPTVSYATTAATDGNPMQIGITTVVAGGGSLIRDATTSLMTSTGTHQGAFVTVPAGVATLTGAGQVCQCLTTNSNTCQVCGCAFLGLPTSAPTSSPTTAPTVNTASPTDSSYWNVNLSDDSLSAGDIAGIVIGAVGGSFLFLLIGVLVGGMVGGKSAGAAAAPAGQL